MSSRCLTGMMLIKQYRRSTVTSRGWCKVVKESIWFQYQLKRKQNKKIRALGKYWPNLLRVDVRSLKRVVLQSDQASFTLSLLSLLSTIDFKHAKSLNEDSRTGRPSSPPLSSRQVTDRISMTSSQCEPNRGNMPGLSAQHSGHRCSYWYTRWPYFR